MTLVVEARNLWVDYRKVSALKGVDVDLPRGEFAVLVGPNGSGKTTFLRALAGTLTLSRGSVRVCGHDIISAPYPAKMSLGFCIAPADLPELLTGRECMTLFSGARGLPGIPADSLSLAEKLNLLPMLDWRIEECSLGTRQKIGILLGLIDEPPLLLLDEPFNGLDPYSSLLIRQHLADAVAEREVGVLLATHDLSIAERYATRVLLLINGQLRKTWMRQDLVNLREGSGKPLEQVLAEACRPDRAAEP